MGCLFELIFDIFLEGSMELTAWCYIKIIQLIVPEKTFSERTRKTVKTVTGIIGMLCFLAILVGLIMLLQDGTMTKTAGKYTVLIALTLSLLPMVLGAIVWGTRRFLNKGGTSNEKAS